MNRGALLVIVFAVIASACGSAPQQSGSPTTETVAPVPRSSILPTTTTTTPEPEAEVVLEPVVRTGAQVLVDQGLSLLSGERVGLIAHQSSVVAVDGVPVHLGDVLHADADVELVALFGPEHGIRGTADAGVLVNDEIDPNTGVRVFSLFGSTRQPTPEMLEGIEVLVYDLQDVGTRYYTYISTMGLAMQAAAQAGIRFVVLDRPNPLGGAVGGGVLEPGRTSFVGQYPVPDQYGLTAGELALEIVEQGWLPGLEDLELDVVAIDGWTRDMRWDDTGLEWVAPSPALDTPESALLYPATIWFEATSLSYGRGTTEPFRVLGAPWLDADSAVSDLTSRDLPGVAFEVDQITPELLPGVTVEPAFLGQSIAAVRLRVTDAQRIRPTELGIHLLDVMATQARDAGADLLDRPSWLDQLSGNTVLRIAIESGDFDVRTIIGTHVDQRSVLGEVLSNNLLYE